jgi:hypothetical protein
MATPNAWPTDLENVIVEVAIPRSSSMVVDYTAKTGSWKRKPPPMAGITRRPYKMPAFECGFMSALRPVPAVIRIHASQVIFWKWRVLATQMPQKTAERAMGALFSC